MRRDRNREWPAGAVVFTDQEGGTVKRFPDLPPAHPAAWYRRTADAFVAGRATGRAFRKAGVDVDLAPVLDAPDGPLGTRHFRRAELGVAFARGLAAGGAGACAKHFPGLGSTPRSTDEAWVFGIVRGPEVAGFRKAVEAGVPCVMVSHAIYPRLGRRRASLEPKTYELLRSTGFQGVAITDALGVLGRDLAPRWARTAVRAGADLVLFTTGWEAALAVEALVPLARTGELDEHVARVLAFRRALDARTRR